ncbi:MAG: PAS domain S-box protein, partial [Rhodospirillaceae bacterium]|nr:PAS domain S-box protein [Rhodospirillaceae bacterium]
MRILPRYWLVGLVLVLSLMGVGGWWYLHNQEELLRRDAEENLRAIATLKVMEIDEWRRDRMADARVLVSNPTVNRAMRLWAKGAAAGEWQSELLDTVSSRLLMMQEAYRYHDIRVVDGQNRVLVGVKNLGREAEDRCVINVLDQARKSGVPEFGDFNTCLNGQPVVDVVAALFADDDDEALRARGLAVVLDADPEKYLYPLVRRWPGNSKTAETLLVRRQDGRVQFLTPLRHRNDPPLTFFAPLDTVGLPAALALKGVRDVVSGLDYRGVRVLAIGLPVPGTGWVMISKIDEDEALEAQRRTALLGMWVLLVTGVAVVAVTLVAWGEATTAQHDKVIQARAEAMEHEARLASIFRAAPIGVGFLRGRRIFEVNDGFCALLGYARDEVLGTTTRRFYGSGTEYAAVGRRVLEQLDKGRSAAVEVQWYCKDGRIIDVILNAALIDPENRDAGVSFTVTDISERKRQEMHLQQRRNELERRNNELAALA